MCSPGLFIFFIFKCTWIIFTHVSWKAHFFSNNHSVSVFLHAEYVYISACVTVRVISVELVGVWNTNMVSIPTEYTVECHDYRQKLYICVCHFTTRRTQTYRVCYFLVIQIPTWHFYDTHDKLHRFGFLCAQHIPGNSLPAGVNEWMNESTFCRYIISKEKSLIN